MQRKWPLVKNHTKLFPWHLNFQIIAGGCDSQSGSTQEGSVLLAKHCHKGGDCRSTWRRKLSMNVLVITIIVVVFFLDMIELLLWNEPMAIWLARLQASYLVTTTWIQFCRYLRIMPSQSTQPCPEWFAHFFQAVLLKLFHDHT